MAGVAEYERVWVTQVRRDDRRRTLSLFVEAGELAVQIVHQPVLVLGVDSPADHRPERAVSSVRDRLVSRNVGQKKACDDATSTQRNVVHIGSEFLAPISAAIDVELESRSRCGALERLVPA